ncbi:glyoxalase domain-containing protein 4 isoform X2 [Leucoraja erinacea]|uniref:glyoxalase domain-containing protein 4 isoform X2 n=1 Tax=Leucoraja erinaceus TaxID=7782 RepID=UPI002455AB84|nr:glyoxalase domain-containing protein 4 isoform X2 [Leucoraja erinacea]
MGIVWSRRRSDAMVQGRALHFVLRVGDREVAMKFYREVLGMKVLRHEEFQEGCKATCNGPYDGKWSKTMVGYGAEENHFVVELTYNYGVAGYRLGNDFLGITIQSKEIVEKVKKAEWPLIETPDGIVIEAPGGYKFYVEDKEQPLKDPVQKVSLAVSDLQRALNYWTKLLGMKIYHRDDTNMVVQLCFEDDQLSVIESKMKKQKHKVLMALVVLDTPGKVPVQVVILADPDGHEICLVGDTNFRLLSVIDLNADKLVDEAITADTSTQWFVQNRQHKPLA